MQNVLLDKMSGEYLKSRKTVNGKVVAFELTEDAPLNLRGEIERSLGWGVPTELDILKQEKEILAQSVYEMAEIIELILMGGIE